MKSTLNSNILHPFNNGKLVKLYKPNKFESTNILRNFQNILKKRECKFISTSKLIWTNL